MCQSQSTPKVASGSEVDQSSGFHILEIHAPTASAGGMSAIIFLMLAGVIFLCVRRYCRCWRAPPRPPQPPPAALARCTSLQPQPESPIPVLSAQLQQQQMLLQNQLLQLRRDIYELADDRPAPLRGLCSTPLHCPRCVLVSWLWSRRRIAPTRFVVRTAALLPSSTTEAACLTPRLSFRPVRPALLRCCGCQWPSSQSLVFSSFCMGCVNEHNVAH